MRRFAHGEADKPERFRGGRTLYPYLSGSEEEEKRVLRMQGQGGELSEEFLRRYFVWVRPLITNLPSSLKYFVEKCYPRYDLTRV